MPGIFGSTPPLHAPTDSIGVEDPFMTEASDTTASAVLPRTPPALLTGDDSVHPMDPLPQDGAHIDALMSSAEAFPSGAVDQSCQLAGQNTAVHILSPRIAAPRPATLDTSIPNQHEWLLELCTHIPYRSPGSSPIVESLEAY